MNVERRSVWIAMACVLSAGALATAREAPHVAASDESVSPEQALERLRAGNEAFRHGMVGTNHLAESWRASLAEGQHPFAIVLSCADSRVPPEQVFAQGLGDLFTVRVAGNVAEPATIASIEYAAAHLGARLVLVMGHTQCGAVKAALAQADDTPAIKELVEAIRPAIATLPREATVDDAVRANVRRVHEQLLEQSALLRGLVQDHKLEVKDAVYDLATGEVHLLDAKE
jgi:carbonic anhydrase